MSCQEKWNLNVKYLCILTLVTFISLFILKRNGEGIRGFIKSKSDDEKLPDLLHYYLPDLKDHYIYTEILFWCIIVGFILFSIIKNQLCIWYQVLFLLVLFHFIKLICSIITILPDPSGICKDKKTIGGCNELMPSGHMSTLLILLFCFWSFMDKKQQVLFTSIIGIYAIAIICVKNHYTIDVIMSFFVVYTLFHVTLPYLINTCDD